tara:strand:- start:683 stop:1276 length:594 start_codon:yes stop_codon:yes gene_type:complete
MEFGTVLKNTILFLLIIFILHFMINNLLIDMDLNGLDEKKSEVVASQEANVVGGDVPVEVDVPQPEREEKKVDDTKKMKDLYDYVYKKDSKSSLDMFFKKTGNMDENNTKDVQVKCADSLCDNVNNYCNTSLPVKQEIQGHYSNFNKVQCEADLKGEEKKHMYIVKKYDNESPMNGGKLDETTIEAFDSLDECFETL